MIVNKYNKGGGSPFDPTQYYTKGEVDAQISGATEDLASEDYVDSEITVATSQIQSQVEDIERVTATALTELHDSVLEISGATQEFATISYVTAATADLVTSAQTQDMIDEATSGITEDLSNLEDMMETKEEVIGAALVDLDDKKVESSDVHTIVKLTQAEYDLISTPDPETLYIIINNQ